MVKCIAGWALYVYQGAVCGAWIGLGLNLVLIIGNALTRPYRHYLDISTSNCSSLGYDDIRPMPQDV